MFRRFWSMLERFGLWGALDQGVLAGSGFIVILVVARTGGAGALGAFAAVQSLVLIGAGVLKAGFADPLIVYARTYGDKDGLKATSTIVAGLTLLGACLVAGLALLRDVSWIPSPSGLSLACVSLLPMASFSEVARSVRLIDAGERHLVFGDFFVALARLVALLLWFGGIRGLPLGLVALAAGGIASVLSILRHVTGSFEMAAATRLWKLGRWLVGESVLYGLGAYGVWLLAAPRAGATIVGELRAMQQLFAPVQVIVIGLNVILLARIADNKGRLTDSARSLTLVQVVIVAVWALSIIGLGTKAGLLLFGEGFAITRVELTMLSLGVFASCVYEIFALRLRAASIVRPLVATRGIVVCIVLAGTAVIGVSFIGVTLAYLAGQIVGICLASAALSRWQLQFRREVTGVSPN